jgi:hypothetical protein
MDGMNLICRPISIEIEISKKDYICAIPFDCYCVSQSQPNSHQVLSKYLLNE